MKQEQRDRRKELLMNALEADDLSSALALMTYSLDEDDLAFEDDLLLEDDSAPSVGAPWPPLVSPEGVGRARGGLRHEEATPLKVSCFHQPEWLVPGYSSAHSILDESLASPDRLVCIQRSCCHHHHHHQHICRVASAPAATAAAAAAPRLARTVGATLTTSSRAAPPPTTAAMTTLMVPQLACPSFVSRRGISNEDPLQQPQSLHQHHLQQQQPHHHHHHQNGVPVSPTVVTPYVCGKMFHMSNLTPSCCLAVSHHHHHHQGLCPAGLSRSGSGFEGEARCPHVVHSCQHRCPNHLQVPPMVRLSSVPPPCPDATARIHTSGGGVMEMTSDGGGGGGGEGGGEVESLWGSGSKAALAFTSKNPFNPFNPFNDNTNLPLPTSTNQGSCRSIATTALVLSLPPTLTTSTTSTTTNPFITSGNTNPFVTSRSTPVPPQTTNTSSTSSSSSSSSSSSLSTVIGDGVDARITSPPAVWTVEDDHRVLERTRRAVRECGWYMSDLSHNEALAVLRGTQPGTFVLRDSSDPRYLYSFTVQTVKEPTSVRVHYSHGKFRLDCASNASTSMPSFGSLMGLVDYYTRVTEQNDLQNQHVWIDASGKKFAPIEFRRPLRRTVPSLQHLCRLAFHKGPGASQPPSEGELPVTIMHYLKEYPHGN
ncbi:uncharacterized protein LOC143032048 [Oratosquilla oratoria]|uniref:uncharacterized protein LOC143032048 n=1 Tax=Oratosquilla oratoria TaxID=337810 RepID=UPI003F770DC4